MLTNTIEKLLAFHGDRAIKTKYLGRLRAHAKALFKQWVDTGVKPEQQQWDKTRNTAWAAAAARRDFYRRHGYWPRWRYRDYRFGKNGQARYVAIGDKLISLLKAAPVAK